MEVAATGENLKSGIAFFGVGEASFDFVGDIGNGIGGSSADVDLLNLDGGFESVGVIDIDEDGVIKIDAIIIDRRIGFFEHADDNEFGVVVLESAGENISGAEKFSGKVVADDGGVVIGFVVLEKLTIFERKLGGVHEVGIGGDNVDGLVRFVANSDGGNAGCDRSGGLDVAEFGNGGRVS